MKQIKGQIVHITDSIASDHHNLNHYVVVVADVAAAVVMAH